MHKRVVILIQSDPRASHRPCEALRIALGLASCRHSVDLILSSTATLLLAESGDPLVESEASRDYLHRLQEWVDRIWIFREAMEASSPPDKTAFITPREISEKILGAACFMVF